MFEDYLLCTCKNENRSISQAVRQRKDGCIERWILWTLLKTSNMIRQFRRAAFIVIAVA